MNQFTAIRPSGWEDQEVQEWLTEMPKCSRTHISNMCPILDVDYFGELISPFSPGSEIRAYATRRRLSGRATLMCTAQGGLRRFADW